MTFKSLSILSYNFKSLKKLCAAVFMAAAMMIATAATSPVSATTYALFDHGDGAKGPFYGLRLDSESKFFSFGDVSSSATKLFWDGVSSTANISGTIWLNSNPGTAAGTDVGTDATDGEAWTLTYSLTGVAASGAGFTSTGGSGSVSNISTTIGLTGKAAGASVFNFLFDGHRCGSIPDCDVGVDPVARGWIMAGGTNDFLLRAAVVPLPAGAILLLSGLLGLGFLGRYRRKLVG